MVSYLLSMTYNFWKIWNKICPCGLSDQTFSTLFESNPLDWNWTFAITFAIKTTKFEAAWHNGLRSILKEHYFLIFHDPKIKKKSLKTKWFCLFLKNLFQGAIFKFLKWNLFLLPQLFFPKINSIGTLNSFCFFAPFVLTYHIWKNSRNKSKKHSVTKNCSDLSKFELLAFSLEF